MRSSPSPQATANRTRPDALTLAAFGQIILLGGSNSVAVRFTVLELPPFWGAALRFAPAALIFWVILLVRRIPLPTGRPLLGVLLYGFLNIGASYAFTYLAIRDLQAGLAQVILSLVPILTFLFAFAHRLEPFRWRVLLGGILALGGIALAFLQQPGVNVSIIPVLLLVAAAACAAEATVVVKQFPQSHPIATNALAMTLGALMLLALSLLTGESWSVPSLAATWAAILYLVTIGSVALFYVFLFVVRRWTASAASYQFVLFPFVSIAVAAWLLGEAVTLPIVLGGALVLVGVWIGALYPGKQTEGMRMPRPQELPLSTGDNG